MRVLHPGVATGTSALSLGRRRHRGALWFLSTELTQHPVTVLVSCGKLKTLSAFHRTCWWWVSEIIACLFRSGFQVGVTGVVCGMQGGKAHGLAQWNVTPCGGAQGVRQAGEGMRGGEGLSLHTSEFPIARLPRNDGQPRGPCLGARHPSGEALSLGRPQLSVAVCVSRVRRLWREQRAVGGEGEGPWGGPGRSPSLWRPRRPWCRLS